MIHLACFPHLPIVPAILAALGAATAPLSAQMVDITPVDRSVSPRAINNLGAVVGYILGSNGAVNSTDWETLLWTPSQPNGTTGTHAFQAPAAITFERHLDQLRDINDQGVMVGIGAISTRLFAWGPTLGTIALQGMPLAINNANQVLQDNGRLVDLAGSASRGLPAPPGASGMQVRALAENGRVVGRTWTTSPMGIDDDVYLWVPSSPNTLTGTPYNLGKIANARVNASDTNSFGQIVGSVILDVGTPAQAPGVMLWQPDAPESVTGTFHVFANTSVGSGPYINERGWVAFGTLQNDTDTTMLWVPFEDNGTTGALIELGGLEKNNLPSTGKRVADINDQGQVLGATSVYVMWIWSAIDPATSGGTGSSDNDLLEGTAGADTLDGDLGDDALLGGDGADTLLGGGGNDTLDGGDGEDLMNGGVGDDTLTGGPGNDVLDGGPGSDILYGGTGDDMLDVGSGDSTGDDTLDGGAGDDTLFGGQGNDTLIGGPGNDAIEGRSGNDDITSGTGEDIVDGGAGNDLIRLAAGDVPATGLEIIAGGSGFDTVLLTGIPTANVTMTGNESWDIVDPSTGGAYRLSGIAVVQ